MRPLYNPLANEETLQLGNGNTGLWYDKFCNEWLADWSGLGENGKKNWIDHAVMVAKESSKQNTSIAEASKRLSSLICAYGQAPLFFTTGGPFVTGLGRAHPVENGFAWHHTLGVPYLPGSSVKGLVRAWAEQWSNDNVNEEHKAKIKRIFGPKQEQGQKKIECAAGSIIFLDALPTKPVQLKADIMTPHYGPYYQDESGATPPADWHSPVPIPFLVVKEKQCFQFGVIPRLTGNTEKDEQTNEDCQTVTKWLGDALQFIGAGAKTAVGYGRFKSDKDESEQWRIRKEQHEKKIREEKELQDSCVGLSPLAVELNTEVKKNKWLENKNAFCDKNNIEDWLKKLEADPQSYAVKTFSEIFSMHFPGLLQSPEKEKIKGTKVKPNQRKYAERLNDLKNKTHDLE